MRMQMVGTLAIIGAALLLLPACTSWRVEKKYPPIGRFAEIDRERVHYLDYGTRGSDLRPVVLIHGASVNLRDMKIALGDTLAAERRVIIVDRAGRGYSSRPSAGWRLDRQAALIRGLLDDLGVDDPIIIGQSLGGAVALSYAINQPDRMSALMLLAPVSHEWPGGVAWYNSVSGWPVAGTLFRRLVLPAYAQLAAKGAVESSFAPDEPPDQYFTRAGVPLLFRPSDFRNNAADITHLKREVIDMTPHYGAIAVPTVIITGDDDTTVSPVIHSEALARDIAQSRLIILDDTGHALHHAETARIIDALHALDAEIAPQNTSEPGGETGAAAASVETADAL